VAFLPICSGRRNDTLHLGAGEGGAVSTLPPSTPHCIRQHALTAPNATAFIEGGFTCSYAELARTIAQMRKRLLALGIAPGLLVAVACDSRFAHWVVLLACETIGAATVSFIAGELGAENALLARCDYVVFTAAETGYRTPLRSIDIDRAWLAQTFAVALTDADLAALDVDPAPDQIVRVLTSSGTTGAPKAMSATHRSHVNHIIEKSTFLPPEGRPRFLCFYRPTVLAVRLLSEACLRRGGLVLLSNAETLALDLATYRPHAMTILTGHVPAVLEIVRTAALAKPEGLRVRAIGARLGREWRDRLLANLAEVVVDGYGCNVAGGLVAFDGGDEFGVLAADTEVEIVDEAGNALPHGTAGIIRVKTNRMVEGYLGDAELTSRLFKDGWFLTSDVGVMSGPDRLKVIGRKDEVLNIGGIKTAPETLEEKIAKLRGITGAAVLSLPNENGIEELAVAVEMKDDVRLSDVEPELRRLLGEFYPVGSILAVAKLPCNENGKVRRGLLADLFKPPR
jgi:acyl-CoA synthetase (AMP-forming)/AMP-acid ligase II